MKTIIYFLISFIFMIGFNSCNQETREEVTTTTKTSVSEPDGGFLLKKQVVVKGNTVWGFSQKQYGTGMKWRDIVAQNPFLDNPSRTYYDKEKGMWIVLIYPGEVVKLGNEAVNPTYVVEETTTKTTITKPGFDWWKTFGIIALITVALILLVSLFNQYRPNVFSSSSSSSAVHVDIHNGIDIDTRRTLLCREQDFQDHALDIIEKGAKKNGRLLKFKIKRSTDKFFLSGKYSPRYEEKTNKEEKAQ